jgi:predicted nuclease of predicted toxin-antitoxin system
MRLWLDVHLSPRLVPWMTETFGVEAASLIDLGMYTLKDEPLFQRASREVDAIMTKDSDFLRLVTLHGRPPAIIYLTCGNTTNAELRRLLSVTLSPALSLITQGESVVEIGPLP